MSKSPKIFELGRGKKLMSNKYWHQFLLKFDFSNKSKPFIISEIGQASELSSTNLSIKEIQEEKYLNHLKNCTCKNLLVSYATNREKMLNQWQSVQQSNSKFEGKWTTTKIIEVLDYKSNHGNWDYTDDIPGHILFELDSMMLEEKNCSVSIPVMSYDRHTHIKRYVGRFELAYNYILIWQNDIHPVKIKFKWINNYLELELFETKILFKKK